jgi:SulP family sulfate permease
MLIIWGLPKHKSYPASLIAILAVFGIVFGFGIDTKTVGDIASIQGFPPFHIIIPFNLETLVFFPYGGDYGWSWINEVY